MSRAGVRRQLNKIPRIETRKVILIGTISLGGHDLPIRLGTVIKLELRLDKLLRLGVSGRYRWQLG